MIFALCFKLISGQAGLADDGFQGADSQFGMVGNGDRDGRLWKLFLHHDVASASADFLEAMAGKDGADLFAGKDTQATQR